MTEGAQGWKRKNRRDERDGVKRGLGKVPTMKRREAKERCSVKELA